MKINLSSLSFLLILIGILSFSACQETSNTNEVLKASLKKESYPKLLDRSEAIRNGKEWDLVQNQYANALKKLNKNATDHEAALKMVEVFIMEARVTGEHGHYYPAALTIINKIRAENPESKDIQFQTKSLQAAVLLSQHEFKKALEVAREGVSLYPYNAGIHGSLTDAYVELGEYKSAVAAADRMMSIRPDLRSYSRVSYLREIHGDMEGAIEAMKLAVSAGYPGYEQTAWARLTLGNLYEAMGKLDEAEGQYNTILQERNNYAFVVAALAGIAEKRGNLEKAERLLKQACAIIPEVGFYVQLATLYKSTNRSKEAEALIKEILVMLQDDVDSGHNMNLEYADLYLELVGDNNKALDYVLAEYEKRPKNLDVNLLLSKIYYKKGDNNKAKVHLKAASITNSKNSDLLLIGSLINKKF